MLPANGRPPADTRPLIPHHLTACLPTTFVNHRLTSPRTPAAGAVPLTGQERPRHPLLHLCPPNLFSAFSSHFGEFSSHREKRNHRRSSFFFLPFSFFKKRKHRRKMKGSPDPERKCEKNQYCWLRVNKQVDFTAKPESHLPPDFTRNVERRRELMSMTQS